jgi:flavin reductase (DIM6/NTAB) family NADH-FMN oxidoreductase RutF
LDETTKGLYRQALGCFTTGVAVVTVADGAKTVGLTVNSFTSLSLDPPLVLWCLGKASDRGVWFLASDRFVVNVLGAEDAALAASCARRGAYVVDPARVDLSRPGEPAIEGALARLHCRSHERVAIGDHLIMIGEVVSFDSRAGDGLTYFRSRYGRAALPEDA